MKAGWEVKPLGAVISLEYGKPLEASDRDLNGLYPVYGANGEISRTNKFYYDKSSIIVGRKGSAGEINLTETKFWPLDVTYFVKLDQSLNDLQFIYYLLESLELRSLAKGVKPGINRNEVYSLEVKIPSKLEQLRIVAILDQAFEGIAKARANAEQNLQNARALFKNHLQSVFIQRGEGWEIKTLNQIAQNLDNKRIPITKNVRSHGAYPYYGASGIVDYVSEFIFDDDLLLISEDGANLLARTYPIAFSIHGKTWVNNHAHVLRFNDMTTQKLVEFYLNSIPLNDFVSGMAQPKLNQKMLNTIPIPFPPLVEQQVIVAKLDELSVETQRLEALYQRKITLLDELKKSLLQQAFAGEL